MICSYFYFDLYFKADKRFEETVYVEAIVLTAEPKTSYSSTLTVQSYTVNREKFTNYKFSLTMPKEDVASVTEGDKVRFSGTLEGFESDGDFNAENYYYSDGISAFVRNVEDFEVYEKGNGTVESFFTNMRERVRRLAILMTDKETGNLLSALLTGERDELSGQLKQDFLRIGITHILALSGTHLSLLSLAVNKVLSLFHVRKKLRSISVILFASAYMVFVGFSVSVVRAGIMLIISSLLYLFSEDSDPFNSLTISVFLIVLVTPYAIYDVALWLSAFATLGVIVAMRSPDTTERKYSLGRKVFHFIGGSLMTSVYAMGATMLISVATFKGFSLMAPIGTLLFSVLTEIYMYIGTLMLLLGALYFPLSVPFSLVMKPITSVIIFFSELLSTPDFAYINANYDVLIYSTIAFSVLFFLFMIIKLNRRIVSLLVLVSFTSLFAVGLYCKFSEYNYDSIVYSADEKADMFIMKSGGDYALVSSSQYSKNKAYDALAFLKENHISSLDKYILTHYSYSLEEDFEILLSNILINEIFIPHPKNEDEHNLYNKLSEAVKDYRVSLKLHNEGGVINVGNFKYSLIYSHAYGEGSSKNAFMLSYKMSMNYLYLSSGMMTEDQVPLYTNYIKFSDVIIFGAHGKKYSEKIYLDENYDRPQKLIISGENFYLTQKSYMYYDKKGCEIYSHPETVTLLNVKH